MEHEELIFRDEPPEYGKNYDRGWIGFNHAASWMSKGIAFITRSDRKSGIPISHVFIVTGEDECVEAAFGKGVIQSSLSEQYFEKEDRYVVFRKPLGLTESIADQIVETARRQLGSEFNNAALGGYLISDSFVGWVVNRVFHDKPKEFMAQLIQDKDRWICSELAAYCLNAQPAYRHRGVLKHSASAIEPQRLFEDDEIFEPLDTTIRED